MNILGLGLPELIVIAPILLLFFGSKRLPGLFRSIGSSINELKTSLNEGDKKTEDTVTVADSQSTEETAPNESKAV